MGAIAEDDKLRVAIRDVPGGMVGRMVGGMMARIPGAAFLPLFHVPSDQLTSPSPAAAFAFASAHYPACNSCQVSSVSGQMLGCITHSARGS
jgi:hypothetical protein